MGDENGAGFVWQVVTIVKVGLHDETGCCWSWCAEYAYGKQPIPWSAVLFDILAPGVVEQHHSAGTTKEFSNGHAVSLAITHAFSSTLSGPNPQEAPGQQTFELKMDQ